jgi:hypothetical protein
MEGGHLPEDVAERAREAIETRDEEARPECSVESAVQLRETLREVNGAEAQLLHCDSLDELPQMARIYAEAHERLAASMHAVAREAGVQQIPVEPRRGITTRD